MFIARLGRRVAETRVHRLSGLDRARTLGVGQAFPIRLAQADEALIAPLGGQIHPDVGLHRVARRALAFPVHLRDHALRRFVGEETGPPEILQSGFMALLVVGLQPQQAVLQILMVFQKACCDQQWVVDRIGWNHAFGSGRRKRCGMQRRQAGSGKKTGGVHAKGSKEHVLIGCTR